MSGAARRAVWGLIALLALLSAALWIMFPPPGLTLAGEDIARFAVLLVAFVVVEAVPLTVGYRDHTMHLTLSGMGVVVGTVFLGPVATLLARLLGSGVALQVRFRNPAQKFLVNLAAMSLEVWAVGSVLGLADNVGDIAAPSGWLLVAWAALAGEIAMGLCTFAAMRVTLGSGALPREQSAVIASGTLATTGAVATLSILAIVAIDRDPVLTLVVAAALGLPMAINRQLHTVNLRYQSLRGLYRFTVRIDQASDTEELVDTILAEAAETLGATTTTLMIIDGERTSLMGNAPGSPPVSWVSEQRVRDLAEVARSGLVIEPDVAQAEYAGLLPTDQPSMAASLAHPDIVGVLAVSGRSQSLPAWDERDLELAAGVARQAGTGLAEARLVDRLREERHRVEQMGLTDKLTGLRNREGLLGDLPRLTSGGVAVVALRDLDEVSTGLGHSVGERLIATAGQRLVELAGRQDLLLSSFGDGRFVVVAPSVADVIAGSELARLIEAALSGPVPQGPLELELQPVLGLALAPAHGTDTAELVRAADKAMRQAVENGMGVAWFDADYDREGVERLQMAAELRRALDAGRLTLAYQPKVDLATGRVVGVEALARWTHPDLGFVSPAEFVDVAERTGLIRPLTLYVVESALAQAARWRGQGLELSMAVNLSIAVVQDPRMAHQIVDLVSDHGLPPQKVTVEITESQVMADAEQGSGVLEIFGAAGLVLSVDDFGTGYSSLAQLKNLPVQELKIDKSFVRDLAHSQTDRAIVGSVLRLASELDLQVVAEGIEDEASRAMLVDLECDVGQGYLFAKPLPAARILPLIEQIHGRYAADLPQPVTLPPRSARGDG